MTKKPIESKERLKNELSSLLTELWAELFEDQYGSIYKKCRSIIKRNKFSDLLLYNEHKVIQFLVDNGYVKKEGTGKFIRYEPYLTPEISAILDHLNIDEIVFNKIDFFTKLTHDYRVICRHYDEEYESLVGKEKKIPIISVSLI